MKKIVPNFPEGTAIFERAFPSGAFKTHMRKRRERSQRLLMIHSRARGVYTVLKDVIPNWTEEQRLDVEEAVKVYIKNARENGWREVKK